MTISFSGPSSGIDTNAWVEALVKMKQASVTNLEQKKETLVYTTSVLDNVKSFFASFKSVLTNVTQSNLGIASFDLFLQNLVETSNADVVTASVTTEAQEANYEVYVDQVATETEAKSAFLTNIISTTQDIATHNSLLSSIGIGTGKVGFLIGKDDNGNDIERIITLQSNDTIGTFLDKLNKIGIDASYDPTMGLFSINVDTDHINDIDNTGIIDALCLQNVNSGYSSDFLELTDINSFVVNATETAKMSLFGITDGTYTITDADGNNPQIFEADTEGTFLDFFNAISRFGLTASFDDEGIITINTDGRYLISGALAEQLGIVTDDQSHDTDTKAASTVSAFSTEVVNAEYNSTLGEIGAIVNNSDTLKILDVHRNLVAEITSLTKSSTIDDLFDALAHYSIAGSLNNNVISFDSALGYIIEGKIAENLGVQTYQTSTTTIKTGNSTTSTGLVSYLASATDWVSDCLWDVWDSYSAQDKVITVTHRDRVRDGDDNLNIQTYTYTVTAKNSIGSDGKVQKGTQFQDIIDWYKSIDPTSTFVFNDQGQIQIDSNDTFYLEGKIAEYLGIGGYSRTYTWTEGITTTTSSETISYRVRKTDYISDVLWDNGWLTYSDTQKVISAYSITVDHTTGNNSVNNPVYEKPDSVSATVEDEYTTDGLHAEGNYVENSSTYQHTVKTLIGTFTIKQGQTTFEDLSYWFTHVIDQTAAFEITNEGKIVINSDNNMHLEGKAITDLGLGISTYAQSWTTGTAATQSTGSVTYQVKMTDYISDTFTATQWGKVNKMITVYSSDVDHSDGDDGNQVYQKTVQVALTTITIDTSTTFNSLKAALAEYHIDLSIVDGVVTLDSRRSNYLVEEEFMKHKTENGVDVMTVNTNYNGGKTSILDHFGIKYDTVAQTWTTGTASTESTGIVNYVIKMTDYMSDTFTATEWNNLYKSVKSDGTTVNTRYTDSSGVSHGGREIAVMHSYIDHTNQKTIIACTTVITITTSTTFNDLQYTLKHLSDDDRYNIDLSISDGVLKFDSNCCWIEGLIPDHYGVKIDTYNANWTTGTASTQSTGNIQFLASGEDFIQDTFSSSEWSNLGQSTTSYKITVGTVGTTGTTEKTLGGKTIVIMHNFLDHTKQNTVTECMTTITITNNTKIGDYVITDGVLQATSHNDSSHSTIIVNGTTKSGKTLADILAQYDIKLSVSNDGVVQLDSNPSAGNSRNAFYVQGLITDHWGVTYNTIQQSWTTGTAATESTAYVTYLASMTDYISDTFTKSEWNGLSNYTITTGAGATLATTTVSGTVISVMHAELDHTTQSTVITRKTTITIGVDTTFNNLKDTLATYGITLGISNGVVQLDSDPSAGNGRNAYYIVGSIPDHWGVTYDTIKQSWTTGTAATQSTGVVKYNAQLTDYISDTFTKSEWDSLSSYKITTGAGTTLATTTVSGTVISVMNAELNHSDHTTVITRKTTITIGVDTTFNNLKNTLANYGITLNITNGVVQLDSDPSSGNGSNAYYIVGTIPDHWGVTYNTTTQSWTTGTQKTQSGDNVSYKAKMTDYISDAMTATTWNGKNKVISIHHSYLNHSNQTVYDTVDGTITITTATTFNSLAEELAHWGMILNISDGAVTLDSNAASEHNNNAYYITGEIPAYFGITSNTISQYWTCGTNTTSSTSTVNYNSDDDDYLKNLVGETTWANKSHDLTIHYLSYDYSTHSVVDNKSTLTVGSDWKISDLRTALAASTIGITLSVSGGTVSLDSKNGKWVSGDIADIMGLSYTTKTLNCTWGGSTTSSSAITGTINASDTVWDYLRWTDGADLTVTIRQSTVSYDNLSVTNSDIATITIDKSTTFSGLSDLLSSNSSSNLSLSLSNGVTTLNNANNYYAVGDVMSSIGISTTTSTQAVAYQSSTTSSSALTYSGNFSTSDYISDLVGWGDYTDNNVYVYYQYYDYASRSRQYYYVTGFGTKDTTIASLSDSLSTYGITLGVDGNKITLSNSSTSNQNGYYISGDMVTFLGLDTSTETKTVTAGKSYTGSKITAYAKSDSKMTDFGVGYWDYITVQYRNAMTGSCSDLGTIYVQDKTFQQFCDALNAYTGVSASIDSSGVLSIGTTKGRQLSSSLSLSSSFAGYPLGGGYHNSTQYVIDSTYGATDVLTYSTTKVEGSSYTTTTTEYTGKSVETSGFSGDTWKQVNIIWETSKGGSQVMIDETKINNVYMSHKPSETEWFELGKSSGLAVYMQCCNKGSGAFTSDTGYRVKIATDNGIQVKQMYVLKVTDNNYGTVVSISTTGTDYYTSKEVTTTVNTLTTTTETKTLDDWAWNNVAISAYGKSSGNIVLQRAYDSGEGYVSYESKTISYSSTDTLKAIADKLSPDGVSLYRNSVYGDYCNAVLSSSGGGSGSWTVYSSDLTSNNKTNTSKSQTAHGAYGRTFTKDMDGSTRMTEIGYNGAAGAVTTAFDITNSRTGHVGKDGYIWKNTTVNQIIDCLNAYTLGASVTDGKLTISASGETYLSACNSTDIFSALGLSTTMSNYSESKTWSKTKNNTSGSAKSQYITDNNKSRATLGAMGYSTDQVFTVYKHDDTDTPNHYSSTNYTWSTGTSLSDFVSTLNGSGLSVKFDSSTHKVTVKRGNDYYYYLGGVGANNPLKLTASNTTSSNVTFTVASKDGTKRSTTLHNESNLSDFGITENSTITFTYHVSNNYTEDFTTDGGHSFSGDIRTETLTFGKDTTLSTLVNAINSSTAHSYGISASIANGKLTINGGNRAYVSAISDNLKTNLKIAVDYNVTENTYTVEANSTKTGLQTYINDYSRLCDWGIDTAQVFTIVHHLNNTYVADCSKATNCTETLYVTWKADGTMNFSDLKTELAKKGITATFDAQTRKVSLKGNENYYLYDIAPATAGKANIADKFHITKDSTTNTYGKRYYYTITYRGNADTAKEYTYINARNTRLHNMGITTNQTMKIVVHTNNTYVTDNTKATNVTRTITVTWTAGATGMTLGEFQNSVNQALTDAYDTYGKANNTGKYGLTFFVDANTGKWSFTGNEYTYVYDISSDLAKKLKVNDTAADFTPDTTDKTNNSTTDRISARKENNTYGTSYDYTINYRANADSNVDYTYFNERNTKLSNLIRTTTDGTKINATAAQTMTFVVHTNNTYVADNTKATNCTKTITVTWTAGQTLEQYENAINDALYAAWLTDGKPNDIWDKSNKAITDLVNKIGDTSYIHEQDYLKNTLKTFDIVKNNATLSQWVNKINDGSSNQATVKAKITSILGSTTSDGRYYVKFEVDKNTGKWKITGDEHVYLKSVSSDLESFTNLSGAKRSNGTYGQSYNYTVNYRSDADSTRDYTYMNERNTKLSNLIRVTSDGKTVNATATQSMTFVVHTNNTYVADNTKATNCTKTITVTWTAGQTLEQYENAINDALYAAWLTDGKPNDIWDKSNKAITDLVNKIGDTSYIHEQDYLKNTLKTFDIVKNNATLSQWVNKINDGSSNQATVKAKITSILGSTTSDGRYYVKFEVDKNTGKWKITGDEHVYLKSVSSDLESFTYISGAKRSNGTYGQSYNYTVNYRSNADNTRDYTYLNERNTYLGDLRRYENGTTVSVSGAQTMEIVLHTNMTYAVQNTDPGNSAHNSKSAETREISRTITVTWTMDKTLAQFEAAVNNVLHAQKDEDGRTKDANGNYLYNITFSVDPNTGKWKFTGNEYTYVNGFGNASSTADVRTYTSDLETYLKLSNKGSTYNNTYGKYYNYTLNYRADADKNKDYTYVNERNTKLHNMGITSNQSMTFVVHTNNTFAQDQTDGGNYHTAVTRTITVTWETGKTLEEYENKVNQTLRDYWNKDGYGKTMNVSDTTNTALTDLINKIGNKVYYHDQNSLRRELLEFDSIKNNDSLTALVNQISNSASNTTLNNVKTSLLAAVTSHTAVNDGRYYIKFEVDPETGKWKFTGDEHVYVQSISSQLENFMKLKDVRRTVGGSTSYGQSYDYTMIYRADADKLGDPGDPRDYTYLNARNTTLDNLSYVDSNGDTIRTTQSQTIDIVIHINNTYAQDTTKSTIQQKATSGTLTIFTTSTVGMTQQSSSAINYNITVTADSTNTFSQLGFGAEASQVTSVYSRNGEKLGEFTLSATSTLADFCTAVNNLNSFANARVSGGKVYIDNGYASGALATKLGLVINNYGVVTYTQNETSASAITYYRNETITTATTLRTLGFTTNDSVEVFGSDTMKLGEFTLGTEATVGDFINAINSKNSGAAKLSNGVISISNGYITGTLAEMFGLNTQAGTYTTTTAVTATGDSAVIYTVINNATSSTKLSEVGVDLTQQVSIYDRNGNEVRNVWFNENSDISEFLSVISNTKDANGNDAGVRATYNGSKISITNGYVKGQCTTALGISVSSVSTTTTSAMTLTSSTPITYVSQQNAVNTTTMEDLGIDTTQKIKLYDKNGVLIKELTLGSNSSVDELVSKINNATYSDGTAGGAEASFNNSKLEIVNGSITWQKISGTNNISSVSTTATTAATVTSAGEIIYTVINAATGSTLLRDLGISTSDTFKIHDMYGTEVTLNLSMAEDATLNSLVSLINNTYVNGQKAEVAVTLDGNKLKFSKGYISGDLADKLDVGLSSKPKPVTTAAPVTSATAILEGKDPNNVTFADVGMNTNDSYDFKVFSNGRIFNVSYNNSSKIKDVITIYGLGYSVDENGFLTITGDSSHYIYEDTSGGISEYLRIPEVGENASYSVQNLTIYSATTTSIGEKDICTIDTATTFAQLGLNANEGFTVKIYKNGRIYNGTVSRDTNISQFFKSFDLTMTIGSDGKVSISGDSNHYIYEDTDNILKDYLKIESVGYGNSYDIGTKTIYTLKANKSVSISADTTLAQLGLNQNYSYTIKMYRNGRIYNETVDKSTQILEFLTDRGISVSVNPENGTISLSGDSNHYIYEDTDNILKNYLKIANVGNGYSYSSSTVTNYRASSGNIGEKEIKTITDATTFAQLGLNANDGFTVKIYKDGRIYNGTVNRDTNISQFFASFGLTMTIGSDGKVSISGDSNHYIYEDTDNILGTYLHITNVGENYTWTKVNNDRVSSTNSRQFMQPVAKTFTADTTFADLGISLSSAKFVRSNNVISNGTVTRHDTTFTAESTTSKIVDFIKSAGFDVTVNNGQITIKEKNNNGYYINTMNSDLADALNISVGEGHTYYVSSADSFGSSPNKQLKAVLGRSITEETTLSNLLINTPVTVTTNKGSVTIKADDKVMAKIRSLGLDVSAVNGTLSISGTDSTYITGMSDNLRSALKFNVGENKTWEKKVSSRIEVGPISNVTRTVTVAWTYAALGTQDTDAKPETLKQFLEDINKTLAAETTKYKELFNLSEDFNISAYVDGDGKFHFVGDEYTYVSRVDDFLARALKIKSQTKEGSTYGKSYQYQVQYANNSNNQTQYTYTNYDNMRLQNFDVYENQYITIVTHNNTTYAASATDDRIVKNGTVLFDNTTTTYVITWTVGSTGHTLNNDGRFNNNDNALRDGETFEELKYQLEHFGSLNNLATEASAVLGNDIYKINVTINPDNTISLVGNEYTYILGISDALKTKFKIQGREGLGYYYSKYDYKIKFNNDGYTDTHNTTMLNYDTRLDNLSIMADMTMTIETPDGGKSIIFDHDTTIEEMKERLFSDYGIDVTIQEHTGRVTFTPTRIDEGYYILGMDTELKNALKIITGENGVYTLESEQIISKGGGKYGTTVKQNVTSTLGTYGTSTINNYDNTATQNLRYEDDHNIIKNDTRISRINGYNNGNGNITVHYADGYEQNISIRESMSLGQLCDIFKDYGVTTEILAGGRVTFKSNDGTYLKSAAGGSNLLDVLNVSDVSVKTEGTTIITSKSLSRNEEEEYRYFATEDTLLSTYSNGLLQSNGVITFALNDSYKSVTITSDDTFGTLIQKFKDKGLNAKMEAGKFSISSGYDTFSIIQDATTTSSLAAILNFNEKTDLGGYAMTDRSKTIISTTTLMETKSLSISNYADDSTQFGTFNVIGGSLSIFIDGKKAGIQVSAADTVRTLQSKFRNALGQNVNGPDGENLTVKFEDGCLKIYQDGANVIVGSNEDSSNFSAITGAFSNNGAVESTRSFYKANENTLVTAAGIFRNGTVTAGDFVVGDATISIDNTTTIGQLVSMINTNSDSNVTAYWDGVNGELRMKSNNTGDFYINFEGGSSNFTDVMGYTRSSYDAVANKTVSSINTDNQKNGKNARVTINGASYTSTSNTMGSDVTGLKGLTLNLKGMSNGEATILSVKKDVKSLALAISDVVDAYNALIDNINTALNSKSELRNDSELKRLRNHIKSIMTGTNKNSSIYKSIMAIGIVTDAADPTSLTVGSGIFKLTLDYDKFAKAFEADSASVRTLLLGKLDEDGNLIEEGILTRLEALIDESIDSAGGYFERTEESFDRQITRLDNKIVKGNEAIERYRERLEKKYMSMNILNSNVQTQYQVYFN